jgi:hypothetical protein
MGEGRVFQVDKADPLAERVDRVLPAVGQDAITVGIDLRDVAG